MNDAGSFIFNTLHSAVNNFCVIIALTNIFSYLVRDKINLITQQGVNMDNVKAVIFRMINNTDELIHFADDTLACAELIIKAFEKKGKLLLCGNGGSCADCDHITGELMKGFLKKRPLSGNICTELEKQFKDDWATVKNKLQQGLPAISLCAHSSLMTAFNNDVDPDLVFAQQVLGYGTNNDILIAMSTSGNSKNVVHAVKTAKALGLKAIGFTGSSGGQLKKLCDICFCVPSDETYRVQEYHICIYHALCAGIEEYFFRI